MADIWVVVHRSVFLFASLCFPSLPIPRLTILYDFRMFPAVLSLHHFAYRALEALMGAVLLGVAGLLEAAVAEVVPLAVAAVVVVALPAVAAVVVAAAAEAAVVVVVVAAG